MRALALLLVPATAAADPPERAYLGAGYMALGLGISGSGSLIEAGYRPSEAHGIFIAAAVVAGHYEFDTVGRGDWHQVQLAGEASTCRSIGCVFGAPTLAYRRVEVRPDLASGGRADFFGQRALALGGRGGVDVDVTSGFRARLALDLSWAVTGGPWTFASNGQTETYRTALGIDFSIVAEW